MTSGITLGVLIRLMILSMICLAWRLYADAPTMTADQPIEFDQITQSLNASGNVLIRHDKISLQAERVKFLKSENVLHAHQNVVFTMGAMRLLTQSGTYSVNDRYVTLSQFKLGERMTYVYGQSLAGTDEKLVTKNSVVQLGEPDPLALNVWARSMTIYPHDSVHMTHAIFKCGKVPFFYLPYYRHSLQKSKWSVKSDWGHEKRFGSYIRNDICYKTGIADYNVGAIVDYYQERGVLWGPQLTYGSVSKKHYLKGLIHTGTMHDRGDATMLGKDILGRDIQRKRGFIIWEHNQEIGEHLDINARVQQWKDSEVLREYRPQWFGGNAHPENFIETTYRGDRHLISVFNRFRLHDFQTVYERLPEIRLDYIPTRIGASALYHGGYLSVAHLKLRPNALSALPSFTSRRVDVYYGFSRPINLSRWLTVTPVAGARATGYFSTVNNTATYTRLLGQVGFDAEARFHADWDYINKIWGIDGLRHSVIPVLQYRYIPNAEQGTSRIPDFDSDCTRSTQLPSIDLSQMRNTDRMASESVLRYGLRNVLLTREGKYGSRELAYANIFNDLHLRKTALDPERWSDIHAELGASPAPWISLGAYERLNAPHFATREHGFGVIVRDGKRWQANFDTSYWKGEALQYSMGLDYNFTVRNAFHTNIRFDGRTHKLVEQHYGFKTKAGSNWIISYNIINRRESNYDGSQFGAQIKFEFVGF